MKTMSSEILVCLLKILLVGRGNRLIFPELCIITGGEVLNGIKKEFCFYQVTEL